MSLRPTNLNPTNPLRMAHDAIQLLSEIRDLLREARDERRNASNSKLEICASCGADHPAGEGCGQV